MKKNLTESTMFIISFICLAITIQQFISLGVFVDEFGLSPDIVLGGRFLVVDELAEIISLNEFNCFDWNKACIKGRKINIIKFIGSQEAN